ncbi:hypothetical protein ACROYT_G014105 [Oculina patagonica]
MIGEETGRKVTPVEAAKQMCSQRDEASKLNFGKGGWLTVQQVMSYFSRPAVMKKLGQLPAAVESIEEDDIETLVQQSERYDLQKRIYNQLTLSILFQMPSEAREITLRLHQSQSCLLRRMPNQGRKAKSKRSKHQKEKKRGKIAPWLEKDLESPCGNAIKRRLAAWAENNFITEVQLDNLERVPEELVAPDDMIATPRLRAMILAWDIS